MKSVTTDDYELAKKFFPVVEYNQVLFTIYLLKSKRKNQDDPPKEWEDSYENAEKYFELVNNVPSLTTQIPGSIRQPGIGAAFLNNSTFARELRKSKSKEK